MKRTKPRAHSPKQHEQAKRPRYRLTAAALPSMPVHECLMAERMFKTGLGSVWISRTLPDGKLAVGMFLLDVFCLGVKNAMFRRMSQWEYEMMLTMNFAESMTPVSDCCLKKLVLETAAYAENLGFSPHEDYAEALPMLEGIDIAHCKAAYRFGRDGNAFYIPGPEESPEMSERIIAQLRQRCGEGGFDFMAEEDMEEEGEENVMTIDDPFEVEQLMNDLEQALPFKASFEERGWKQLIKEERVPPGANSSVIVEKLSYSGDFGGIMCHLSDNNIVCSLTHLRVTPNFPLFRDVTAYQKRRAKKLKRQEKESMLTD